MKEWSKKKAHNKQENGVVVSLAETERKWKAWATVKSTTHVFACSSGEKLGLGRREMK